MCDTDKAIACESSDLAILVAKSTQVMTDSYSGIFFDLMYSMFNFCLDAYQRLIDAKCLTSRDDANIEQDLSRIAVVFKGPTEFYPDPRVLQTLTSQFFNLCGIYGNCFRDTRDVVPVLQEPGLRMILLGSRSESSQTTWDELLPCALNPSMTKRDKAKLLKELEFLRGINPLLLDFINMHRKIASFTQLSKETTLNFIDLVVSIVNMNSTASLLGMETAVCSGSVILPIEMQVLRSRSFSFGIDFECLRQSAYLEYSPSEVCDLCQEFNAVQQPIPYLFRDMIEAAYNASQVDNPYDVLRWNPSWVYLRYAFSDTSIVVSGQTSKRLISSCGSYKMSYERVMGLCEREESFSARIPFLDAVAEPESTQQPLPPVASSTSTTVAPAAAFSVASSSSSAEGASSTLLPINGSEQPAPLKRTRRLQNANVRFAEPLTQVAFIPSRREQAEIEMTQAAAPGDRSDDMDVDDVLSPVVIENTDEDDDLLPTDNDYTLPALDSEADTDSGQTRAVPPLPATNAESVEMTDVVAVDEFDQRASVFEKLFEQDMASIHSEIRALGADVLWGSFRSELVARPQILQEPILLDSTMTLGTSADPVKCYGRSIDAQPAMALREKITKLVLGVRRDLSERLVEHFCLAFARFDPAQLATLVNDDSARHLVGRDIDDILTASTHSMDIPKACAVPTTAHSIGFRLDKIVLAIVTLVYRLANECLCPDGLFEINDAVKNALLAGGDQSIEVCEDVNIAIWSCALEGDIAEALRDLCDSFVQVLHLAQTAIDAAHRETGV